MVYSKAAAARYRLKRYLDFTREGKCPSCGCNNDNGYILCDVCREKNRIRLLTVPRAIKNKNSFLFRERCRKDRICYGCGNALPEGDDHKKCPKCRGKDRIAKEEAYIKKVLDNSKKRKQEQRLLLAGVQ